LKDYIGHCYIKRFSAMQKIHTSKLSKKVPFSSNRKTQQGSKSFLTLCNAAKKAFQHEFVDTVTNS